MTASEFAFLALGLVLGVASGAALIEVLRSRPPAPREVRVTVAPDSVPRRRSATLAEDAFATAPQEPARGGPADRRQVDREPAMTSDGTARRGTIVRSAPLPPAGAGDPASSLAFARGLTLAAAAAGPGVAGAFVAPRYGSLPVAVRVHDETDWTLAAMRSAAARSAEQQMRERRMTATAVLERPVAKAAQAVAGADDGAGESPAGGSGATATGATADPDDPCADARRTADERCTLASRAREQAQAAQEALRAAQRAYDDHHTRAEQAAATADPRQIREAKEAAQHAFRHARSSATNREDVEAAARDWLTEINRINHDAREAGTTAQRERAAANAIVATIERLSVEADAARISAEAAEVACTAAREAVADCQEAQQTAAAAAARAAARPVPRPGFAPGPRADDAEASELEAAFEERGAGEPAILRLVRGDRPTMGRLVASLAGDDEAERRRWQRSLGDLIDAIVGRAIEASALTFPLEHPFWGAFTLSQNRDIVAALSSLGFRFDGLGGWMDDRIPGQRDLSLAVGYAGLDPMRLRRWPNETEMRALFDEVAVAADEYLAETAGDLTLGELVDVLGRRADALAEVWNEWGRIRPLLLAAD